jgi:proteasome activator subunit 4
MATVMISFLPKTHADTYLPAIFKIWEAFNSASLDEKFMELAGDLSRDHVSGPDGDFGSDGAASWKDVGIWTTEQWNLLTSKGLNMMGMSAGLQQHRLIPKHIVLAAVPVGSLKVRFSP